MQHPMYLDRWLAYKAILALAAACLAAPALTAPATVSRAVEVCRQAAGFDRADDNVGTADIDALDICSIDLRNKHARVMVYVAKVLIEDRQEAQALSLLQKALSKGETGALSFLAELHQFGEAGLKEDAGLAADLLRQGMASSHARAYRLYGEAVRDKVFDTRVEALPYLAKAAAMGSVRGAELLAEQLALQDTQASRRDATKWFKKAAEGGSASAMYELSERFRLGLGVRESKYQAETWIERAADLGHRQANLDLGIKYLDPKAPWLLERACRHFTRLTTSTKAVLQAAIALCYQHGYHVKKDAVKAFQLSEAAAAQGLNIAKKMMGEAYLAGEGVDVDFIRGVNLLREAIALGLESAKAPLTQALLQASAVDPTHTAEAEELLQDIGKDREDIRLLLLQRRSVDAALDQLHRDYDQDPLRGALPLLRYLVSAEMHGAAIEEAARIVTSASFVSLPREAQASTRKSLLDSLEKICVPKLVAVADEAVLLKLDQLGVNGASMQLALKAEQRGDVAAAIGLLSRSAGSGSTKAMYHLGRLYEPIDMRKALGWYERSADAGEVDAAVRLAYAHFNGEGLARDYERVRMWLKRPLAEGNPDALFLHGMMMVNGLGTTIQRKAGLANLQRAADLGNGNAVAYFVSRPSTPSTAKRVASLPAGVDAQAFFAPAEPSAPPPGKAAPVAIAALQDEAERWAANYRWDMAEKKHDEIASSWLALGQPDKAVSAKLHALAMATRSASAQYGSETNYFSLLDASCKWGKASRWAFDAKQPEIALSFAKIAVYKLDQAAVELLRLDERTRECFLKEHEDRYRWLADLLIGLGRIGEAEQVLARLKAFEVGQYLRDPTRTSDGLDLMALGEEDRKFLAQEDAIATEIRMSAQREALRRKRKAAPLSPEDEQKLQQTEEVLTQNYLAFDARVTDIIQELRSRSNGARTEQEAALTASRSLQRFLMEVLKDNVVVVQTIVLPDRFHILVTTGTLQRVFSFGHGREALAKKVAAMRSVLKDANGNALPAAQALYLVLIEPIKALLPEKGVVMISADDALRYVPFGALHDGRDFLAKRLTFVNYNPSAQTTLFSETSKEIIDLQAFGTSRAHPDFEALPAVKEELEGLVRQEGESKGILPGRRWLDPMFTRKALTDALFGQPVAMHIASHFRLVPESADRSILLLGDGSQLPLTDLVKLRDLSGLSLMTLSACQTGLPLRVRDASGEEIESLAALVHRSGVRSVIATLWNVSDGGSSVFMQRFYGHLRNGRPSIARALQQTQMDFITGQAVDGAQPGAGHLSHPYYWAGYSIFGNWR